MAEPPFAVVEGDWKLVYRPTAPERSELYHLGDDPGELENLYAERPDEVLHLMKLLANESPWVTEPFEPEGGEDDPAARAAVLEALSSLGYVASDGETLAIEWTWSCPDPAHPAESERQTRCVECGTPTVPSAKVP